jgi:hypothetical protein
MTYAAAVSSVSSHEFTFIRRHCVRRIFLSTPAPETVKANPHAADAKPGSGLKD